MATKIKSICYSKRWLDICSETNFWGCIETLFFPMQAQHREADDDDVDCSTETESFIANTSYAMSDHKN